MRILLVVNVMGRGGAEIQLCEIAEVLARRGHVVGLVSMMPFLDFERRLLDAGVQTFSLGLRGRASAPGSLLEYMRVLRRFAPDVVHSHLFVASIFSRVARLFPWMSVRHPKALICSSHAQEERKIGRYAVYRLSSRLAEAWTSVSREGIAIHEQYGAIAVGSATWIPNGIEVARYNRSDALRAEGRAHLDVGSAFVWLALGSFRDETKDYGTMFSAFSRVPEHSMLLIGGEGRLLEEKRTLARTLGIADRVRFLGLRADVERLLQAADAYVLSSQSEAMPTVLLQAAASSLPIVTTDVGEASAIVQDGLGGFVVPARDPDRLADAMRRVESLGECGRRQYGLAARAHVTAQFDLERVVDRWLGLYTELLSRKELAA